MEKRTERVTRGTELQPERGAQHRVIVRYVDGSMVRGYILAEDADPLHNDVSDDIAVRRVDGEVERIEMGKIKAIFFVKTFEGSRRYSEFKVFTHQPNGKGVWVRVQFEDGEMMEGIAPNSLDTYTGHVFSLTPPDPKSNNERVLVSKQCLKQMQILGLASD